MSLIAFLRMHNGPITPDEIETVIHQNGWAFHFERYGARHDRLWTCGVLSDALVDVSMEGPWRVELVSNHKRALREGVHAFMCERPDIEVHASPDYWSNQ